MLKVFHYDRSTAAQRVRLLIEEKSLDWESIIVDTARGDVAELPNDYYDLNPKGLIPVIIDGGIAIPESLVILEYLEDKYPQRPFRPSEAGALARMRLWLRKIDEGIHVASRTIGVCLVNRHIYKAKNTEVIKTYYDKMKDTVRKRNDQINIEHGLQSPLLPDAVVQFKKLFHEMDKYLTEHKWLAGSEYSIADIALVVYLCRLESFMMRPLWKDLNSLNEWYARISNRKAFKKAIIDWGDITEKQRRENGNQAYETLTKYWNEV
jgi:glutathione S-transferase